MVAYINYSLLFKILIRKIFLSFVKIIMNTYVKNSNQKVKSDNTAMKLYSQFKQHFSPLLLAKIAKFVHKLKLSPSSSLFFSKIKLYDTQMIQRQNNLIKQQNQKNKILEQDVYLNETLGNSFCNIQKNINQKRKQKQFLQQLIKSNKNKYFQKFSFDDFEKVSKYIEIMLRRINDFESFINYLKSQNIKITEQLKCKQQMLDHVQNAKLRMSTLANFNAQYNHFEYNPTSNLSNRPIEKQYYRLSMDRKRPYSTERVHTLNNKRLFNKKTQNIRFQTQIVQNKNIQKNNNQNTNLKRFSSKNMHQKQKFKIKTNQNQNNKQSGKNTQNHGKYKRQIILGQAQSQKSLKMNFQQIEWQKIEQHMTYKELSDRRKSNFYKEAVDRFKYTKSQLVNDSSNNNKKNKRFKHANEEDLIQNNSNQQKSRSSLVSNTSFGKRKNNSRIIDIVIEQQIKNQNNKQKYQNTNINQIKNTDKSTKRTNHFSQQQNQQTEKIIFFNATNSVNRKKIYMKRRIGQISESQDSATSTVTNLKDTSKKNLRERRKGQKIDNDMQIIFKRLVSDNSVRNLLQSQQMKQIQKQNKQFNKQKNKLKKKKKMNRLTSINSLNDQQPTQFQPLQKFFFPQSQYLSKNCCTVTEQEIKKIQRMMQPINRYNQSKMILKYGIKNGTDGTQFRYNKIGHLQFNHQYLLRFNSLQKDLDTQGAINRIKKRKIQNLKMQISKAFIKKSQEQEAPIQKSLQIDCQYIQ